MGDHVPMNDWKARAEREAAAVLDGTSGAEYSAPHSRSDLIDLMAMAWLQGAIFATHLDLQALEMGADDLKAAL